MNKIKNVIIVNYAGVNTGDDAIFSALLNIVRNKISKKSKIYVLADNDKVIKIKYDVDDAVRLFNYYKIHTLRKVIRFLRDAHLVIFGGGDVVNGNIKSISFIALALILGLPVMCCGVGAIPIKSHIKRYFTRIVFNKVELITVRDERSKHILESMGIIKPEVVVTSDLAFLLKPNINSNQLEQKLNERIDHDKTIIGVSVGSFDPMYAFYGSWTESKFIKDIAAVCDYMIEKYNAYIVFIPMIIRDKLTRYHIDFQADDELSRKIMMRMKNTDDAYLIEEYFTPQDLLGILRNMRLVIAARLHVLLLASRVDVPVIAVDYAPKIRSFMDSLDSLDYMINVKQLNRKTLQDVIDLAMMTKHQSKAGKLNSFIKEAQRNEHMIHKILDGSRRKYWQYYLFFPLLVIVVPLNYIHTAAQSIYNNVRTKRNK